jgi:hypothetical protein
MRKRFQKGSLQKVRGGWVARWWQDGERKARLLGRISQMTKAQAQSELAGILAPINNERGEPSEQSSFGDFVQHVYLPFYRRKWKRSTVMTNEDRLAHHLTSEFAPRSLGSFDRDELQALLDRKGTTLSFSVVDHLRWDLKQIFDMAVAEGYLRRSPALLLFTPRECRRAATRVMTVEEVRQLFSVLDVRERLIARLALLAGMRPGEIFGLKWARMEADYADIRQRVYRGDIDSPKSVRSVSPRGSFRWAAHLHRRLAGRVARHQCRCVGVPIGEAHDAGCKGQLLAAGISCPSSSRSVWLG